MNTAEKLTATYLRLNGFLLLPHFTVFTEGQHNHADFVGYRPADTRETVGEEDLPRDTVFSDHLSVAIQEDATTSHVGIIGEVRGNADRDRITARHVRYVREFLGVIPVRMTFCLARNDFLHDAHGLRISLLYMRNWIQSRVDWMEERGMHKTGSWALSEEFLADLLLLRRIQEYGEARC